MLTNCSQVAGILFSHPGPGRPIHSKLREGVRNLPDFPGFTRALDPDLQAPSHFPWCMAQSVPGSQC